MKEIEGKTTSGGKILLGAFLLLILSAVIFGIGVYKEFNVLIVLGIVLCVVFIFILPGFFTIQPNQAMVLILFGKYTGTIKKEGWHWANPFYSKKKISLRSRNINGEKIKVNDEMGNPIEIAAVIVWRVENTVEAIFDVDNYVDYVNVQSESALRHLAGMYPYDNTEDTHTISLRGSTDEVAEALKNELQQRLGKAGVIVEEARLSHLAYAPEIAAAMLQRQQAAAIIAARQKIVEGAVGMVQMALTKLSENEIVELDEERKAAMVSNLLVVLCGERNTQPVINTGTLHN
ncbi:band 7 protein [Ruminiclostridium papyrosolvens DSM 2782]|uniref:Band 7 protein n=1 Tax=Ruminiclostridium papyrosolvens DSM 2782 TaxID=588581 RepID=F1T9A6_9FIRM|nr:SPFH domain-containing protein [Ruminiclostridium papyrosolvens]EGD49088.1 band 7 protein [Ruminiclostridium papyrosolvens DSM 2782]WES35568.1 SPFH domain-containing protein [Ruminiclostridium papyrosolvens DSM 2782]